MERMNYWRGFVYSMPDGKLNLKLALEKRVLAGPGKSHRPFNRDNSFGWETVSLSLEFPKLSTPRGVLEFVSRTGDKDIRKNLIHECGVVVRHANNIN